MANGDILSDFGINLLEEEIDDVIFQTNEFLTDATFTGAQGPFWWILQMCMALAALFSIVMAAGIAYKMMVKHEPLDVMKLFRPLAVSIIICWWYPPADTGMAGSRNNWCFLDFLSYIPNCIGSYTHDLYEAEASQISDRFEEVQQLIHVRDTMYTNLQAQADVAHTGTSDPNLIEATMEQTGVDEVTSMEKDAAKLWFTSLTAGVIVGIDKIIMLADEIEPEEKAAMIEIVNNNNELLLKLVNDVLEISRLDSGNLSFDIKEHNITKIIKEIYVTYQTLIQPSLCFILELDETVSLPVNIDCFRFTQVISNFLNNANEFTKEGTITLGCKIYKEHQEVCVYVKDTGKGIDDKELMMIFDRFYKTDEFEQGSGLGLSICKVIIERLAGRIEVHSEVGKGSCFSVILSLANII